MTESEREFLSAAGIGRIGSFSADGYPHMTPVRLSFDGQAVLFETNGNSQKLANIRRNPKIAILVDGEGKKGVLLQGSAEIVRDAQGKEQALVSLKPERVRSWRL